MRKLIFALMAIISTVAMQSQSIGRIDVLYYPNGDDNNRPYAYTSAREPYHGVLYDTLRTDSIYDIYLYGIDSEFGYAIAWEVPYGIQPTGTHYWVFDTYVHQPELSDSLTSLKSWTLGRGYITNSTLADSTEALRGEMTAYVKTETDPTIYSWAKASTKPSYTWSEITGKPTFATVAISGSYNDLTNKPTIPTVAAQYGTTHTKEWNGKATTTTGSSTYTFDISSAGFSSISNIQATAHLSGGVATTIPLAAVTAYSTTSVTVRLVESNNTTVLLLNTAVEGLSDYARAGEVFITVKGN